MRGLTVLGEGAAEASCTFESPTAVFELSELDASPAEYAEALEGASALSELFEKGAYTTEETIQVSNVDIRDVIVARALSMDDDDVNPDPGMPVPARVAERVLRRSRRVAGLPVEEPGSNAAGSMADAGHKRQALEPPGDQQRQKRARTSGARRGARAAGAAEDGRPPVLELSRAAGWASASSKEPPSGSASQPSYGARGDVVRRRSKTRRQKKKRPARAPDKLDSAPLGGSGGSAGAAARDAGREGSLGATTSRAANEREPGMGARDAGGEATAVATAPCEEDDVVYTVADFDERDLRCAPTPQPAYEPIPAGYPALGDDSGIAGRPSHHSANYTARRAEAYRRLLPVEQVRPAVVADKDGQATLAIERLNRSAPGWRGNVPRVRIQLVRKDWGKPRLKALLETLKIVEYAGYNTAFADMNGRTVLYRTTPLREHKGEDVVEAFAADSYRFAAACPINDGDRKHNPRGQHYACIMGVHRQYAKEAYYTRFHRRYEEAISWYFRRNGPARRLTNYLTGIIEERFPAIAQRMRANHEWHYERTVASGSPLKPQFGLFWNFCVNLPAPEAGVPRVFCEPHADAMNCAVLLCGLFVFWLKDWVGEDEWSWLVIWELGVIVECPRGSFLLYPSALLFHFNARIVKCKRGEKPTPANSEELPRSGEFPIGGRGSGVWFTQASMHLHTSEKDSKGRLPDYDELARRCFPDLKPLVIPGNGGEGLDGLDNAPFLCEL